MGSETKLDESFRIGWFIIKGFGVTYREDRNADPHNFQNSCFIETSSSDFHKMIITVLKASFQNLKARVL